MKNNIKSTISFIHKTNFMKFNTQSILFLLAVLTVFSCSKKKDGSTPNIPIDPILPVVTYPDYSAMKPGNYWIYQDYHLDSVNGPAHAQGSFDSCYVEKDTVINGKTYHKYWEICSPSSVALTGVAYLRDSLSYIVDQNGNIHFSSQDFTDTFLKKAYYNPSVASDTFHIAVTMGYKDVSVTVNAGTFTTSAFRQIWYIPASLPYGPTRDYDFIRARGIGMIKKTTGFYTTTPDVYEWRLERYHVQ
jgi:hypothetical protein